MRLGAVLRYPRTVGLLAVAAAAGVHVWMNNPLPIDSAWVPHPINAVPLPNPLYEDGPLSGPWLGDLQYGDGFWYMGDGRGGIWRSADGLMWTRASLRQGGEPRNMQNAPARSINRGRNGTYIATFLGGGGLAWPAVQRRLGMPDRQRAPVARSSDGLHWEVRPVPESCGIHFSATDGDGTWIVPACENRLLVSGDDGRTWTLRETGLPGGLRAPGYQDGVWVVGAGRGDEGGVYTSRDLVAWRKALALPAGVTPKRTLSLNGRLVMTGNRRFIASTPNGLDWRVRFTARGKGRRCARGSGIRRSATSSPAAMARPCIRLTWIIGDAAQSASAPRLPAWRYPSPTVYWQAAYPRCSIAWRRRDWIWTILTIDAVGDGPSTGLCL